MTANTSDRVTANRDTGKLRNQLFLSSALLTTVLLVVAAWVINHQVVGQARQQVQAEVETLLPLYDAVWNEHAQRLATLGGAMADSPIIKTVFGDPRASRDRQTLHEMIADAGAETIAPGDLVLMSDGEGKIFFAEQQGSSAPEVATLAAAREAGESQKQIRCFTLLGGLPGEMPGGRLYQLVLTPVVLHSGNAEFDNTLAVLGTGSEVNRDLANEVKRRIHSDVVFLIEGKVFVSSLAAETEPQALRAITAAGISAKPFAETQTGRSTELSIGQEDYLAFARQLLDFDGKQIGQVVVLRSLAGAGQLFRAISNQLLLLWTLAIAAAWLLSYLIAGRITRPLESLATIVRAFGQGKDAEAAPPAGAQGEVAQLAQAFDQMRQSIKQSQAAQLKNERLATIGQMASSIIHDLRNPLATISTAAEVMQNDGIQPDRRRTMLETQLRASQRMNIMLTEILEFSRGSYKLNPKVQPLVSIVQRAAQELGAQMTQSGIGLKVQIPADLALNADGEKLARVFENLLVNSIQAMQRPEGGTIEIRAAQENGHWRVDVMDDGPGIPLAIRERLFEPFISHGKPGGTGLGLAIARGIVEAHGGKVSLENGRHHGAQFVIHLPQVLHAGGQSAGMSATQSATQSGGQHGT
jgi:signal transduction histidine kinase